MVSGPLPIQTLSFRFQLPLTITTCQNGSLRMGRVKSKMRLIQQTNSAYVVTSGNFLCNVAGAAIKAT